MQMIGSLILSNKVDELHKIPAWLKELRNRVNFSDRLEFKFDLVLNEAIPNVMSYGYTDNHLHKIQVHFYQTENDYCFEILDDGIPFNPLTRPEYQIADSLESASVGGRGIHLIKKMSDKQVYKRSNGFNELRVYFSK